jgi:hypothetical protein
MFIPIWQLLHVSPFSTASLFVCLGTIWWCIRLLRRRSHHVADRFLIGFVGLLSVYQGLNALRKVGLLKVASPWQLDDAVEFLVNSLYLLSAFVLRMSTEDRYSTTFRLRLEEATPLARYLTSQSLLRRLTLSLSDNALRLYMYLCLDISRPIGNLEAREEELRTALSKSRRSLLAGFEELEEQGLLKFGDSKESDPQPELQTSPGKSLQVPL